MTDTHSVPNIELRDVSFAFSGPNVLDAVDLTIGQRDLVCIIGPNGGGKTTLLRLILGLLIPNTGSIKVLGSTPKKSRHRIGYMPQHTRLDPQFPVTVRDVVLMGRLGLAPSAGPFRSIDHDAADAALKRLELLDRRDDSFAALSGGQRQRVLIARALACEPKILLLDEPTANLDLPIQRDLYDLLREFAREFTVVLVSHDVGFVSDFVRSVVCVNRTVRVHETNQLTGDVMSDVYGRDVRMVHHDHDHHHDQDQGRDQIGHRHD